MAVIKILFATVALENPVNPIPLNEGILTWQKPRKIQDHSYLLFTCRVPLSHMELTWNNKVKSNLNDTTPDFNERSLLSPAMIAHNNTQITGQNRKQKIERASATI